MGISIKGDEADIKNLFRDETDKKSQIDSRFVLIQLSRNGSLLVLNSGEIDMKYEINLPDCWTHSKGVDYLIGDDFSESLWQASYDVWIMDVGTYKEKYVFRVIKDYDWENPIQSQEFEDINDLIEEIEKMGNHIQYFKS